MVIKKNAQTLIPMFSQYILLIASFLFTISIIYFWAGRNSCYAKTFSAGIFDNLKGVNSFNINLHDGEHVVGSIFWLNVLAYLDPVIYNHFNFSILNLKLSVQHLKQLQLRNFFELWIQKLFQLRLALLGFSVSETFAVLSRKD